MLESVDKEIYDLMHPEGDWIDLRPNGNYLSSAVLKALGGVLADYYVEGALNARFSGQCPISDQVERICEDRLKTLFKADAAFCQPENYALAVGAVFQGVLKPKAVILAPEPGQGASLMYGHKSNIWKDHFKFVTYGPQPDTLELNQKEISELAKHCSLDVIVVSHYPYPRVQDLNYWKELAILPGRLFSRFICRFSTIL